MKFPYFVCNYCETAIRELTFPLTKETEYPPCPRCKTTKHLDIALGYEDDELDSEMVIYKED